MPNKARLNLPESNLRVRLSTGRKEIWDNIRKKWLVLTPEEWVRQNFINFLTDHRNVDPLYIKQEQNLKFNTAVLRADIVVYNAKLSPVLIVECKAPEIRITRETLEQICRYNMVMKVPYVCVTNGLKHFCFRYDGECNILEKIDIFPSYDLLCGG